MYFTACFSESIFTKHSPKDSNSTALGSTEEIAWPSDICDKQPFQTEDKQEDCDVPQNITSSKYEISSKKSHRVSTRIMEEILIKRVQEKGNHARILLHHQKDPNTIRLTV